MADFDVVFAGDWRTSGPHAAAAAARIRAAVSAGLRVAVLPLADAANDRAGALDPAVVAAARGAGATTITPRTAAHCRVLVVDDPRPFGAMPALRPALSAQAVVCQVPRAGNVACPPRAGEVLRLLFGRDVLFAPSGSTVRSALAAAGLPLTDADMPTVVDLDAWRRPLQPPPQDGLPVVGRWAGGEVDAATEARRLAQMSGGTGEVELRLLGHPRQPAPAGMLAETVRFEPWRADRAAAFLAGLHVFAAPDADPLDGCPPGAVEAMASGLVVVLPVAFEPLFEDGAVYAAPSELPALVRRFAANPSAHVAQAMRGRAMVARRFSAASVRAVLEPFTSPVRPAVSARKTPSVRSGQPPRVMMVTSNGEGFGHLTRMLAVARRLPPEAQVFFFTACNRVDLVRSEGHAVDLVVSHRAHGLDEDSWQAWLREELLLAVRAFRPDVVVFDGSVPYSGLLSVAADRPDVAWVWMRRGLWREDKRHVARQAVYFDQVIEPGEFCAGEDVGDSALQRDRVVPVGPILLVDPATRPDAPAARAALGVPADAVCVAVQLRGRDPSEAAVRRRILARLAAVPGVHVIEIRPPTALHGDEVHPNVLVRDLFPMAHWSRGFDLLVANAGYNTVHECIHGGVPALFVPSEGPGMDDQTMRATYAEACGLAMTLRPRELFRLESVLDAAVSQEFRTEARRRAELIPYVDGAAEAARLILQTATAWRVGRPLASAIARG